MKYKILRALEDNEDDNKLKKTPQVAVILGHLPAAGKEIERAELEKLVDADEKFESRQGAAKVLNFYAPRLIKAGVIEKVTEPVEEKADGDEAKTGKKGGKGGAKKAGEAKAEDAAAAAA